MTTERATLELALREEPQAVMLTNQQLVVISNTDFVPKGLRGNVAACLACVARGRAMGIPDMVALNGIAIIEGKATLSAELMVAIVREHGHSITGDVTQTSAIVKGRRKDNGDEMTAEFNIEMATHAGLLGKNNWKKHPDDMMWARAVSKLCRRLFADCFAGGTYAQEDLADSAPTAEETMDEPERVALEVPDHEVEQGIVELHESDVTEPQGEESGNTRVEAAGSESSGSVTSWEQLNTLAAHNDIDGTRVVAAAKALFSGRTPSSLTPAELEQIWNMVSQGALV